MLARGARRLGRPLARFATNARAVVEEGEKRDEVLRRVLTLEDDSPVPQHARPSPSQLLSLSEYEERLAAGEPLSYLLGTQAFWTERKRCFIN